MGAEIDQQFTKDNILNLRFPYKLWLLINLPNQVLSWSEDGTTILLDFAALNTYLISSTSIFKLKTGHKFLRQLNLHGFIRLPNQEDSIVSPILVFKHENFQRECEELLVKIQPDTGLLKQLPRGTCHENRSSLQIQRRMFDPCFKKVRRLSFIERSRLNLSIYLQMQSENFALNKKLSECEKKSPSSAVSVIELPADSFENPFDSISQFEENPDYAGYYGNASTEHIKQFFDEYLPIYAQTTGEEVCEKSNNQNSQKDTQSKQSTSTSSFSYVVPNQSEEIRADFSANPSNFQIKYSVNLDPSSDSKEYTLNILEQTCSGVASTGPESSVPSYGECEAVNDINGRDEDISMDEYLKFKDNSDKSLTEIKPCPGDENDVKPEIDDQNGIPANASGAESKANTEVEDDEGDSNFKNFFNQYRESINLLYE